MSVACWNKWGMSVDSSTTTCFMVTSLLGI